MTTTAPLSTIWKFAERARTTSLSGVPFTFETLKRMRFHKMPLPSVRTLT